MNNGFKLKIDDLQGEITNARTKFEEVRVDILRDIDEVVARAWPDYDPKVHYVGWDYWDCPQSPFGYCAYDLTGYMGKDECLFCGNPEERK